MGLRVWVEMEWSVSGMGIRAGVDLSCAQYL